jgi:hypothetical protein
MIVDYTPLVPSPWVIGLASPPSGEVDIDVVRLRHQERGLA